MNIIYLINNMTEQMTDSRLDISVLIECYIALWGTLFDREDPVWTPLNYIGNWLLENSMEGEIDVNSMSHLLGKINYTAGALFAKTKVDKMPGSLMTKNILSGMFMGLYDSHSSSSISIDRETSNATQRLLLNMLDHLSGKDGSYGPILRVVENHLRDNQ